MPFLLHFSLLTDKFKIFPQKNGKNFLEKKFHSRPPAW